MKGLSRERVYELGGDLNSRVKSIACFSISLIHAQTLLLGGHSVLVPLRPRSSDGS